MNFPEPGTAVRGSTTGRPIMALLDLLGRRWTLRVLWELHLQPATFRELQLRCEGMSPSVLNKRLGELREAHLLDNGAAGYQLSLQGIALIEHCLPLANWAENWSESLNQTKEE